MKSTHWNFPDSLLQQFNFGTSTTNAPIEVSEDAIDTDELEKKATAEPQAEANIDADDQSDQPEEEGVKSIIDSSPIEEEVPEKELEEPPARTSSQARKNHIIREYEDEPVEEPLIQVISWKGKKKLITLLTSDDKVEHINT